MDSGRSLNWSVFILYIGLKCRYNWIEISLHLKETVIIGFFGYNTAVFMELKLPTANTMLHNHRFLFKACWKNHSNSVVSLIHDVYTVDQHHCLNVCECVLVPVCCFYISMDPCGLIGLQINWMNEWMNCYYYYAFAMICTITGTLNLLIISLSLSLFVGPG